jgi:hypothetical protein
VTRPESGDGGGLPDEYYDYGDRERGTWFEFNRDARVIPQPPVRSSEVQRRQEEYEVARFEQGNRVRARRDVGGMFGGRVPNGTEGHVVSTRDGVFTSYVTVAFDNGYTEEVKTSDVKKLGWLD